MKKASNPRYRHADLAMGVGDPQCYKGKTGRPPRYKVGDRLRVKKLPDLFYNQTPRYTRGVVGTVVAITGEGPAPEDEAWGHVERSEWFYLLRFRLKDVWGDDDPTANPNDSVQAEISDRWLEPA